MKILIATDTYPPRYDGINRFLRETVSELNKEFPVHILAPDYGPSTDNVPVTKIPLRNWRFGDVRPAKFRPRKIYQLVKQHDIIFVQTIGFIGGLALLFAKYLRKKTVLYTHIIEWEAVPNATKRPILQRILPDMIKKFDRYLYKKIDLLIVPAEHTSEQYIWNKIDNKREVVHLGVDEEVFVPPKSKKEAKKRLGIPEDTFVIGYHGRLAREKDLKTLLRGCIRFMREQGVQAKILIVGDGLEEIRESLEKREEVLVTGFKEDVAPYLQAMDVYVLSSTTETSCLSVMEAMSTGLPVISTPVGFVQDYITEGENGFFFPQKNDFVLAKHLQTLYNDKRLRKNIGLHARKTITKRFSWKKTNARLKEIFTKLARE